MAQIQGEEIYLSHSGQEVDDNIDEVQAARGSEASLSARLADIVSDFEADQQRQETEIGTLLDRDAKNIFNSNLIPQTATRNGVTIGRTEKGLHISGTASSTADTQIASFVLEIPGDDYHVYINTATSALNIWCSYRKAGTSSDTYAPAVRDTLNTGDILKYLYFKSLPGGTTFDADVDIMVCTAADYDISSQFVPYAPTNRELYEMILALQAGGSAQSAASLMQAGRIDAELTDAWRIDAAEPTNAGTDESEEEER